MLKAAVIGVGSIGQNHARIYHDLEGVDLTWVYDTSEDAMQRIHARYGSAMAPDLEKALDETPPDLVSICVPTSLHHDIGKMVLSRGIHSLIEKPIASTVKQAEELIKIAADNNAHLTVGHIERFNPAIAALKQRLDNGEIGQVFRVQARRMGPFPVRIRDAGVAIDLATHDIDAMRYIIGGDIVRVSAELDCVISDTYEDLLDGVLTFDNNTHGVLSASRITPTKIRELTVTGAKGMFAVNYITQELSFFENTTAANTWDSLNVLTGVNEGNMMRFAIPRQEPLKAELAHFVESVQADTPPMISGRDGLEALKVALAMVQSGHQHKQVQL